MIVHWFGGPRDGESVLVEDDTKLYAVAIHHSGRMLPVWLGLQRYTRDDDYVDPQCESNGVKYIAMYPIRDGWILFNERLHTVKEGEQ